MQEGKMNNTELKTSDILALDRTRLAAERTLMAWVRTALSMIGFGFTIYKFLQVVQEQSTLPVLRPQAPRHVGLTLVGIGTFAVIIACVQHWQYITKLRPDQPYKPWDLTFVVACLIAFLGLLVFGSIMFRAGAFG
jgi:inner membrane protein YidH